MEDCMVRFVSNREETKGKSRFGRGLNRKSPLYLRYGTARVALPQGKQKDYVLKAVTVAPEVMPGIDAPQTLRQSLEAAKSIPSCRQN
jgi:hypothetical protein